jgi:hypothetical protein
MLSVNLRFAIYDLRVQTRITRINTDTVERSPRLATEDGAILRSAGKPKQIQMPKAQRFKASRAHGFGAFPISFFGFVSDFELRISDFRYGGRVGS